jgi:signal transduction histidine kinase
MLTVHIRTDIGRRGGLSTLFLGKEAAVYPMYMRAYGWRVLGTELVVGFSLFVGLMALAFWATQVDLSRNVGRRDSFYLFAGLAELSWTVRVGDVLVERPPLDWPWWGIVPVMALGAWLYCMTQFCIRAAGWTQQPVALAFGRWVGVLAVFSPVLACLALGFGRPLALTGWYAAVLASFLLFSFVFVVRSVREADGSRRLIALAILVNVAVGLRDFYAFRVDPGYPDNSYMRYSSVVFGLALAYMVLARFKEASAQARDLLANLAARVSEKEMALQQSYLQVEQMAREQERASERTRILRDMHDGVGSHISAAIRQLQSGKASQAEVLQTLRDSMDQLKLTIDAMHLPPGDVAALLANLRYRLAPRFAASDIELLWEVDVLQPLVRLDAQAMRQLQFMLFEALSNVLQHARARVLRIEAVAHEGVRLRIIDDGQGFDVQAPWRKGLLSLRDRALAIGATLTISSQPGRTILEVQLR